MARLPHDFYAGNTVEIAQQLLGKFLVRVWQGESLVTRITETEAYVGRCDKACHAYQYRKTPRTATLFGPPGRSYLYLIYGCYHCLNFVTEPEGEPAGVLIRAVQPISGLDTMAHLRFGTTPGNLNAYQRKNFMNGPGKVCKGLSLDRSCNQMDLCGDTLFVCETCEELGLPSLPPFHEQICAGPRIGIDYAEEAREFPWRFWLEQEAP